MTDVRDCAVLDPGNRSRAGVATSHGSFRDGSEAVKKRYVSEFPRITPNRFHTAYR